MRNAPAMKPRPMVTTLVGTGFASVVEEVVVTTAVAVGVEEDMVGDEANLLTLLTRSLRCVGGLGVTL